MGIVERRSVPGAVRAIDSLADPDYTDAFEADTSGAKPRSPEQWARATFEDAPAAMRWFLRISWRAGLGLRLGPRRSPDHVLGWHILDRAANSVTLELRSWFLYCHLVFWLEDTKLVFSTSIRYERKIGAVIWPPVSILHRRIVRYALKHAVYRGPDLHRRPTSVGGLLARPSAAIAASTRYGAQVKLRLVRALQRHVVNPPVRLLFALGLVPPGWALLETIGRRSGQPRRTPIGDGRIGDRFWIIAEHGHRAAYVRNLQANPRVRVRQGRQAVWRTGTAHVVPDDDPRARQRTLAGTSLTRRLNAFAVRMMGTELLTVRIDLDP
jgi:deazaflavin-dependent oxidoreductase (nitroreductase family)